MSNFRYQSADRFSGILLVVIPFIGAITFLVLLFLWSPEDTAKEPMSAPAAIIASVVFLVWGLFAFRQRSRAIRYEEAIRNHYWDWFSTYEKEHNNLLELRCDLNQIARLLESRFFLTDSKPALWRAYEHTRGRYEEVLARHKERFESLRLNRSLPPAPSNFGAYPYKDYPLPEMPALVG